MPHTPTIGLGNKIAKLQLDSCFFAIDVYEWTYHMTLRAFGLEDLSSLARVAVGSVREARHSRVSEISASATAVSSSASKICRKCCSLVKPITSS